MNIDDPKIKEEHRRILDKQRKREEAVHKFESVIDLSEAALLPVGTQIPKQNMIKTPTLTKKEKDFLRNYTVSKRLRDLKPEPPKRKGPTLAQHMLMNQHIVGGRRTKKRARVRKNKRRS